MLPAGRRFGKLSTASRRSNRGSGDEDCRLTAAIRAPTCSLGTKPSRCSMCLFGQFHLEWAGNDAVQILFSDREVPNPTTTWLEAKPG